MADTFIGGLSSSINIQEETDIDQIKIAPGVLKTDGYKLQLYDNDLTLQSIASDDTVNYAKGISYNKDNVEADLLITSGRFQNAFRSTDAGKIEWYFSLYIGWFLGEEFTGTDSTDRLLPFIKKALDNVILPRLDSTVYVTGTQIHVASFVWNCTTAGTSAASDPFTGSYSIGSELTDGTAVFTAEIQHVTDHTAYLSSSNDDLDGLTKQDSDDSTMGLIFLAVAKYVELTSATAWLAGASNNAGRSYQAVLDMVFVEYQTMITGNDLTTVFQQGTDPITGAANTIQFAADNAEVLLSLRALSGLYDTLSDSTRKGQADTMAATITTGIVGLFIGDHFRYFFGDPETDVSAGAVIARWFAQAFCLWALNDDDLTAAQRIAATTYMNNKIPDWWYDTSRTPHLTLVPLYYMLIKGNDLSKVQEGIFSLEKTFFPDVNPDLVSSDMSIYIKIKGILEKRLNAV